MRSCLKPTIYYQQLIEKITNLGGMFNAHLHLDRADTINDCFWENTTVNISEISSAALLDKHEMIRSLHKGPAYQTDILKSRVNSYLDDMVAANTFRADTFVDVTCDNVGLSAIKALHDIKINRSDEIDLRLGAYSPLGYTNSEPERWYLLLEALQYADFIGSLPEADDKGNYPNHIGFYENCTRMLELGKKMNKEVHMHLDQRNEASEDGTEQLIKAAKEVGVSTSNNDTPMIWAVHVISPSTYEEKRFERLIEGLCECNIGVICCPSAAIGMRQLRPLKTPTYNSIARILEMLSAGIHIRIGSDNMADICSPSTTADLLDEIFILTAAIRFYHIDTLAKIAAGKKLNESEQHYVRNHLERNQYETSKMIESLKIEPRSC